MNQTRKRIKKTNSRRSRRWFPFLPRSLKAMRLNNEALKIGSLFLHLFFLPRIALGFSFTDGANAYAIIHKANNMYFYAAVGLLMASINLSWRIRAGGQMRLWLSRSLACLFFTITVVCILFLVIHFAPEMESIFDWFIDFLGRIFG